MSIKRPWAVCTLLASALMEGTRLACLRNGRKASVLELSKGMEGWGVRSEVKERTAPH